MKTAEEMYPYLPNEENDIAIREYNQLMYGRREAYNEGVKAMQSYASHPSPMSAEQVGLGYYYPLFKFFSDEHGLTLLDSQLQDVIHECKKFIEPASPSVKADGWVSVEELSNRLIAIQNLAAYEIPYYAYGDNEAACDMARRLDEIISISCPPRPTKRKQQ